MNPEAYKLATAMIVKATEFVGLTEVVSNAVWDDLITPQRETEKSIWLRHWMSKVKGWTPGAPYCAAFDGAIVASCLAAMGHDSSRFLSQWTAHVMTNVNMLRRARLHSAVPTQGALWLARFGETASGHAGIVVTAGSRAITTVEGNTSKQGAEGSQRNGDGIWIRNFSPKGRGKLVTQCFCSTEAILELAGVR